MAALTGTATTIALGESYAIRAPGLVGDAKLTRPQDAAARARSRDSADGTPLLDAAFAATGVTEVRRVELVAQPTPAASAGVLRSATGEPAIELEVPDLGPEVGQLVLAIDENDALSWHLPVNGANDVQPATTRGAGSVKRFRIPVRPKAAVTAEPAAQRSLIGKLGRKLLKILVYPITDPVVGAVGEFFAQRWEAHNRAPLLRTFAPENRHIPRASPLTPQDWEHLATGPALFFVHGTFSTSHGGFGALPDAVFAALYEHYQGRVFAYDHPTMATDPVDNIRWLLAQRPADVQLELDIVCHSRGGLVSRTLAEGSAAFGLDTSDWHVRKLALVAVPNRGTVLANPEHMVSMIDRLTTALNLLPSGPVVETLEALITAVKVIGHGALKALKGLAAMHPDGDFLARLNAGAADGRGYRAVSVNFEPHGGALAALIGQHLANGVLDVIFQGAANDLVVPEEGVWSQNGNSAFPLTGNALLQVPAAAGVIHTTVFGHAPVGQALLNWLR